MEKILDTLTIDAPDRSLLLNALLYIFQFDPAKSTRYLNRLIPMLKLIVKRSPNELWTESVVV
jgi:hypothetical protein